MILRLAEQLDVPLRERNQLLLAGGYAPVYTETPLESPRMEAVRAAVRQVLAAHEPCPAVVIDRDAREEQAVEHQQQREGDDQDRLGVRPVLGHIRADGPGGQPRKQGGGEQLVQWRREDQGQGAEAHHAEHQQRRVSRGHAPAGQVDDARQ